MTDDAQTAFETAAESRDAFERADDGYHVTTTAFDALVTATSASDWATAFTVTVQVPTLSAAVDGEVGDAVVDGWFDAFERRLADAPTATRVAVELESHAVEREGDTVTVTYQFEYGDVSTGLDVAKTFVEYVEGTYVEGIVPGYEYLPPVSDLLSRAAQGDGERGGTPL